MAFHKNKALENALKALNQGKVPQAIAEYQQILRHDPKDQATLMTVGDLFARQGDLHQAAEYFGRLAQVYLDDGFNSKAIAIYKKISKLAPAELAPLEHLADLYVQQGVLSEARPIFLQLAEAHLKSNQAPKAVEVLRRLVEIEPDNSRVQMRLAELYNVIGQKKESAKAYFEFAHRLFGRGESAEALKFIDRALEVEPGNPDALFLKAKILAQAQKNDEAAAILSSHPEAGAGGDVTSFLVELEVGSGRLEKAAERGRKLLAANSGQFELLYKVAESLIGSGQDREALPLLRELCDPMIEAGQQDKYLKTLSGAAEKLSGDSAPLEMLADFCARTSDPFHLNSAQSQLVDAYAAAGDYSRAEELLQELIDRNKDDERLVQRLEQLRGRQKGEAVPEPARESFTVAELIPASREPEVLSGSPDEALDEETEAYISQALTDVDLFSSYGLAQKAINLLENVLQRAPRHTPTLERLLDFYVGAANDRRTAEVAAQLEQIHRERGDASNAERFGELRQRFQNTAGIKTEDLPPAPPARAAAPPAAPPSIESIFAASSVPAESEIESARPPAPTAEFEIPAAPAEPQTPSLLSQASRVDSLEPPAPPTPEPEPVGASDEVDLSDEWEAMTKAGESVEPETARPAAPVLQEQQPVSPVPPPTPLRAPASKVTPPPAQQSEPVEDEDLVLELSPASGGGASNSGPATTEEFLNELAAEIEDMQLPDATDEAQEIPVPRVPSAPAKAAPVAAAPSTRPPAKQAPKNGTKGLSDLDEIFQEFRDELGEMTDEDEDLETHYNLGVAYREMGLLDEAIGEFQKVAKAVQNGQPFAYAMNCSALLALCFMDKGEPKIASVWYRRALETPELDQETILALRYDLGAALDQAGESGAALENFRQVYAMNIDYRDVADRIATLQKQ